MSYILDALKKSQAQQQGEGVALDVQADKKRPISTWILVALGVLLAANLGVMAWFAFAPDTTSDTQVTALVTQNAPPIQVDSNTLSTSSQAQETRPQDGQPKTPASTPTVPNIAVQDSRSASVVVPPSQTTAPVATQPIELPRFALGALADYEQTLYNSFRYSSHMFSPDDPTAGAIFIDGQMLRIGDSFKGLIVADITEFTVVFEENRRGKKREVEVNLADQWER